MLNAAIKVNVRVCGGCRAAAFQKEWRKLLFHASHVSSESMAAVRVVQAGSRWCNNMVDEGNIIDVDFIGHRLHSIEGAICCCSTCSETSMRLQCCSVRPSNNKAEFTLNFKLNIIYTLNTCILFDASSIICHYYFLWGILWDTGWTCKRVFFLRLLFFICKTTWKLNLAIPASRCSACKYIQCESVQRDFQASM